MKKERNRGSLPSSSSTPRVQSCAELQESQHSEATDNLVCTNQSLSGLRNNNFKIFEFKSPDPKIPPVTMHDIAGTDDSRPIRQFSKIATHHGPFVPASVHIRSQSVPKSTASKSQVRFYENARRFSDPSHVYGKVLSLGSETSTVSSQPVNQSSSSDKLFPEEPHNYAGSADEMSHLSVRTDLPTADKHVEPSLRHIEDNSSMFEFSILYNQWTQISQMRNQVQALRFKLQIKRRELRILQRERSLAEDAYFKQVQMRELNMPFPRAWWSEKSIAELLNDSQKARNEYGSMEDEYIQIENDLDSQEWELSQQENYFYSQLQDPSRFFRRPIEFEYAAKSQEEPEHFEPHPLVDSYLLKLGGLENLRESFDEILDEKLDLEEQLAVRKRFNMTLMPEDQQWLDSSQSQLDDLASKIQVAETEERELRQQCFSLGLIDENGEPIEPSKHGQHSLSTDTDPETLENPRESVQILSLLPPGPSDMEIGIKALDFDHNYSSRNERFDRWSLEKLQVSLLEINIYANCFENFDDLTDLSKLKERVHDDDFVTAWFSDGFTDSAPRSKGFTSIHSTPQHIPRADLSSKVSPSDFVFSKGSPHSESDHSDTAEGE